MGLVSGQNEVLLENNRDVNMVPSPASSAHMFVRSKEHLGSVQIGTEQIDLVPDVIFCAPWKDVAPLVVQSQAELL